MSAKIKTKLQKLTRLQDYFSELEDHAHKKVKTNEKSPVNLVNKTTHHVSHSKIETNNKNEEEDKENPKGNQIGFDEKDNQLVKLDVDTLKNISKNEELEENPSTQYGKLLKRFFFINFSRSNLFLK